MNDDLEHTLRDSLDRHAAGLSQPSGAIDDVYARVDRHRSRRRAIAVLGSVVAVAVGVAGFAALADRGEDPAFGNVEEALGGEGSTTTVAYLIGNAPWSCAGHLGRDGDRELSADCHPVTGPTCAAPTSTIALTVPTVVEGTSSLPELATTIPVPDPCPIAPTYDFPECAPPTTPPPVATTIEFAEDTVPDVSAAPRAACAETYVEGTAPPTTVPTVLDCRAADSVDSTTTVTSTVPISPDEQIYTVVAGDTLIGIALRYGVEPEVIANYNGWDDCLDHPIFVADIVRIPPGARSVG